MYNPKIKRKKFRRIYSNFTKKLKKIENTTKMKIIVFNWMWRNCKKKLYGTRYGVKKSFSSFVLINRRCYLTTDKYNANNICFYPNHFNFYILNASCVCRHEALQYGSLFSLFFLFSSLKKTMFSFIYSVQLFF